MAKNAPRGQRRQAGAQIANAAAEGVCAPGTPDRRYPVHNDPYHEIVCKCINGSWVCMQVSTGASWQP
jgi:hypothetical protein